MRTSGTHERQEVVRDMLSAADLDRELAVAEGTVRRALERGQIAPADHALELGDRTYFYFDKHRVEEIRQALGVEEVAAQNIKRRFFQFIQEMDMSASYKPSLCWLSWERRIVEAEPEWQTW